MRWRTARYAGVLALLGALWIAPPLPSQEVDPPDPVDEMLRCQSIDGGVLLQWDPILFFVPIEGFTISRDGEFIAKIPDGSTEYFDPGVAPGSHVYVLSAINWDGTVGDLGRCEVWVEDFGLRCKVDRNLVSLEWGPILIDVWISEFRIYRDGTLIGTAPSGALGYEDQAPNLGKFRYTVRAVLGDEDSTFLIGSCTVEVECFGIETQVDGNDVHLAWTLVFVDDPDIQPPDGELTFFVLRDNELVGRTAEQEYTDTVPGPGVYVYQVYVDHGTGGIPAYLLGACVVSVGTNVLPPPRNLTCTVLSVSPEAIPIPVDPATGDVVNDETLEMVDTDGDGVVDSYMPVGIVVLEWTNPVRYDRLVIARNKAIVATLPGDTTRFVDRVPTGQKYVYTVTGVRGLQRSPPATCEVEVPPSFVPPPQDFRCVLLDMILDPTDPDLPPDSAPGADGEAAPVDIVLLSWWNPVRYSKIVIMKDLGILATLPGDAMRYRDVAPTAGHHVYGIYGILGEGRRSVTVTCEVFVGPHPVPPVMDLRCSVLDVSPAGTTEPSVLLSWVNAAGYDRIRIHRNADVLVDLPGDADRHVDPGLAAGVYVYEVTAILGDQRSLPVPCEVVVPGPPQRNILYFSPLYLPDDPAANGDVEPPASTVAGDRITSMATTAEPVQGWSFGVASDPKFIVPVSIDLDETITETLNDGAGPDFLHVNILEDGSGVVMAAVIDVDHDPPSDPLPPDSGHRLLNIEYDAGPSGNPGEIYEVRYVNTLGDPPVHVLFVVDGFDVRPATRPGWVSLEGIRFIRGDVDESGEADMTDAIVLLGWLFLGKEEPGCLESADTNRTGELNIADPIYLLQFLFNGGPPLPFPYPECGAAPGPLGCKRHEFCGTQEVGP